MSSDLARYAFALAALLVAGAAPADPSERAPVAPVRTADDARNLYREGVRAFAAGRYARAIELFREADQREPSAALSFNMARAYEKLGDDRGALRCYRDYLRAADAPEDAAQVRRMVQTLSRRLAERGVQQVTVLSSPPGATVVLDAAPVGVSPWTSELTPGVHNVALHLDGRAEVTRTFQVPADEAVDVLVAIPSEPPPASPPTTVARVLVRSPAPVSPEPAPVHPSSPPGKALQTVGIVALSAGVATLGGALAFELSRRSAEHAARDEQEQVKAAEDIDTMQSRRNAARILGAVGGGLVAVGGMFVLLQPSSASAQDRTAKLKIDVTSGGVGAWVSGRF